MNESESNHKHSTNAPLSDRHLRELHHDSAIPLELIAQGGVKTITTRGEAACLGYRESWQQLVPAIAFPVHPPDGTNGLYVIKPDRPRPRKDKAGKFVKYEWPHGRPHRLDVVGDIADLSDPAVDLYVVEGWKKAACVLAQMRERGRRCVIVVVWGVWAWGKKPDEHSRCDLLPDWQLIALDGRRIFIVFDSDREEKDNVDLAARQLAARVAERGGEVYHVILPSEPDGSKNGADDLIVRHGFESFEECVEIAVDRGPHGTEALRAAWRRQRDENRELRRQLHALAQLRRDEDVQSSDLRVGCAIAAELGWRRSKQPGPAEVNLERIADSAGVSASTVGQSLKKWAALPNAPISKTVMWREVGSGEQHKVVILDTPANPAATTADVLERMVASHPIKAQHGGKREPRCPDHPDATFLGWQRSGHFDCGCVVPDVAVVMDDAVDETKTASCSFTPETDPTPSYVVKKPQPALLLVPEVDQEPVTGVSSSPQRASTRMWTCRVCLDQMVGGPRCHEHNPTPEQRAARTHV